MTLASRHDPSGGEAVQLERVEPEEAGAGVVGQVAVVLAELVDHARVLRVVVREVGGPDEAIGADDRSERAGRALARVEADPALALGSSSSAFNVIGAAAHE